MAASDAGASSGIPEAENCSDIRLLLSALVDGEASPEEAFRAKSHVLICPNCASHLAFLRLTGRALSQVPEMLPSPSLSARIAAATYERPTLAERIAGWLRPAPVRVALGTMMAAGLALVLIVPRMGGEIASSIPSAPNNPTSGGTNAVPPAKKAPAKNRAAKSVAKASASVGVTKPADAPDPEVLPEAVLPSAETVPASAPASRKPVAPIAPIKVARAELNPTNMLLPMRTEARIDRSKNLRSSINSTLRKPGAGGITIPRSGYDRAAVTEPKLKPRDVASATPALPLASGVTPSLSPLPSENTTVKMAEPGSASAERIASRPAPAATSAAVVASAAESASGPVRIRLKRERPSKTELLFPSGADSRAGSLSANDQYSFANGNAARIGITSAPVK